MTMETSMQEYMSALEYIDSQMDDFTSGELSLFIVELSNKEKVVALCDIEDPTFLFLPVHLIEHTVQDYDSYSSSYRLYSYCNIADPCSELILSDRPKIMFAPKKEVIDAYFSYWEKIKRSNDLKLDPVLSDDFLTLTTSLS